MKVFLSVLIYLSSFLLSLFFIYLGCNVVSGKYLLFAIAGFMSGIVFAQISGERNIIETTLAGVMYCFIFVSVSVSYMYMYVHYGHFSS